MIIPVIDTHLEATQFPEPTSGSIGFANGL